MTKEIPNSETFSNPADAELEKAIIDAIQDRKGKAISLLDFGGLESAPARTFIICQGNSSSQVSAIADNIRDQVRLKLGSKPFNYDGYRNAQWIVIDYGNVLVHVFQPEVRTFYNIEDLWSDARITEIPDLD